MEKKMITETISNHGKKIITETKISIQCLGTKRVILIESLSKSTLTYAVPSRV